MIGKRNPIEWHTALALTAFCLYEGKREKMKSLVITGDSLSYNRYGYDEIPRLNAWDCHIGMPSWSFRLRNLFLSQGKGFRYADELIFDEENIPGVGENASLSDAIFGERGRTIRPRNGHIRFFVESDTGSVVLYFQKRPQNHCRFTIAVDGVVRELVDTQGTEDFYQGWALLPVVLSCCKDKKQHEILLHDFDVAGDEAWVTLAGVSSELRSANVTGQGSQTVRFIREHFEERIAPFSPDLLVLIFGGNDILCDSPETYRTQLRELLTQVRAQFSACKVITVTIPPSKRYEGLANGVHYDTQQAWDDIVKKYNQVMIELSAEYHAEVVITEEIMKDFPIEKWRYDEVHFTNFGNDILYEEVRKKISGE